MTIRELADAAMLGVAVLTFVGVFTFGCDALLRRIMRGR